RLHLRILRRSSCPCCSSSIACTQHPVTSLHLSHFLHCRRLDHPIPLQPDEMSHSRHQVHLHPCPHHLCSPHHLRTLCHSHYPCCTSIAYVRQSFPPRHLNHPIPHQPTVGTPSTAATTNTVTSSDTPSHHLPYMVSSLTHATGTSSRENIATLVFGSPALSTTPLPRLLHGQKRRKKRVDRGRSNFD